jgi:hypothetical protein
MTPYDRLESKLSWVYLINLIFYFIPLFTVRFELWQYISMAAALLLYPVYVSRVSGHHCSPEQAMQELLDWRAQSPGDLVWWRRWLRPWLARA